MARADTSRSRLEEASGPRALSAVRTMFAEYGRGIGVDLSFQGFDEELRSLPGAYARPNGRLLIARSNGRLAGCAGLRPRSDSIGEIKRLYVRDRFRGKGIGRALTVRLIEAAREIGYREVVLDTLASMTAAVALYRSLGFGPIPPYYANPIEGARFFRLSLGPGTRRT